MSNIKNWDYLYKNIIEEYNSVKDYYKYKIKSKHKFIKSVLKYAGNKPILETGCGTGLIATHIKSLGYNVSAIDLDENMINLAKHLCNNLNMTLPDFQVINVFENNYESKQFSVIYSFGVLEHFTDDNIIDILKQQSVSADYIVFGVPTKFFQNNALHGDERYLDQSYWESLIDKANCKLIKSYSIFNYKYWKQFFNFKNCLNFKQFYVFEIKTK